MIQWDKSQFYRKRCNRNKIAPRPKIDARMLMILAISPPIKSRYFAIKLRSFYDFWRFNRDLSTEITRDFIKPKIAVYSCMQPSLPHWSPPIFQLSVEQQRSAVRCSSFSSLPQIRTRVLSDRGCGGDRGGGARWGPINRVPHSNSFPLPEPRVISPWFLHCGFIVPLQLSPAFPMNFYRAFNCSHVLHDYLFAPLYVVVRETLSMCMMIGLIVARLCLKLALVSI